jgi:arylsulfatase A-like enzyme
MRTVPMAVLLGLLALVAGACRSEPPKPTDVVMIVVDTLRADRLGRYGYPKGLTPVMDRFADRGVRFAHAYAATSWTNPSVASLFTSRFPSQHHISDFDSRLSDAELTLAERLSAAGFATAGFTANWRLTTELGYAQGFKTWRGFFNSPGSEHKARGDVLRDAALAWLDGPDAKGAGRLLYLQYMEPHIPLEPPPPLRARFAATVNDDEAGKLNAWARMLSPARGPLTAEETAELFSLYDAEVAAMDEQLGRLFDALEQRKIFERALVIVTADHGEEFLEHGMFGHGYNLFNTTVHVPLIIAGPGIPAGGVVNENVSLVDLAPTVLELTGLKPEPRFEGRSLVPLLRDAAEPSAAPADVVLQLPRNSFEWDLRAHKDGLVRGREKLLVDPDGTSELYDLGKDPAEKTPAGPPAGAALQAALERANSSFAARQQPEAEKVVVDEATKEKLRALGYHP